MISIEHRDEIGKVLSEFTDPHAIAPLLRSGERKDRCLGFIDPYGDSCFNQGQIPVLLAEIEAALREVPLGDRVRLVNLARFIRGKIGQIHTYLWFVGE